MARPIKKGLDYFPLDVDFFSDKKIKILKSRYGADGISLYIYLLCEIYKNGYYIKMDDDYIYLISDDLNMKDDKVRQILTFLLERSLFDNILFQSDAVLTSTGIQKRFQEAIKARASKKCIEIEKYWLLEEHETLAFISYTQSDGFSENNDGFSEINDSKSEINVTKERKGKERKEKERKKEERESSRLTLGFFQNVFLTQDQYSDLNEKYYGLDSKIEKYSKRWQFNNPGTRDHYAFFLYVAEEDKWEKRPKVETNADKKEKKYVAFEDLPEETKERFRKSGYGKILER